MKEILTKRILFVKFSHFFKMKFSRNFRTSYFAKISHFFSKQIKAKFSRNDFLQTLSRVHWEPENGVWMLSLFFLLLNVASEIIIYNLCISYIVWIADIEIMMLDLWAGNFCVGYTHKPDRLFKPRTGYTITMWDIK